MSAPASGPATAGDPFDRRLARRATGLLRAANEAGVLEASDVHVAARLGEVTGERLEAVLLAVALAVRAVRQGSVCVDLGSVDLPVADQAPDADSGTDTTRPGSTSSSRGGGPVWPDREGWTDLVASSVVVAAGAVRVDAGLVYLERYWREEVQVDDDLSRRRALPSPTVDAARLGAALDAHFPVVASPHEPSGSPMATDPAQPGAPDYREQRAAAELAARHGTTVITGGPGTGKTTTVARLLGTLLDLDGPPAGSPVGPVDGPLGATRPGRAPRVALAAPTGKAAARMTQALRDAVARPDFPATHRAVLDGLSATTLHRLLGWRPGSHTRFRHHGGNPLPHDVVVVDETSMVSLTLMARLLEALRPQARLVLVGDADQLASVDAGAVLHDLVEGLDALTSLGGEPTVARLGRSHRYGDAIGDLAQAIRHGDVEATLEALAASPAARLVEPGAADAEVLAGARQLARAGRAGDPVAALVALERHRLLTAHRVGEYGVAHWNRRVERWLREEGLAGPLGAERTAGEPFLVTANDYGLGLFNGDTGVVVRGEDGLLVARVADGTPQGRAMAVSRLAEVETAYAMTVHRSQGSQFDAVTVILPPADSPLLTRELLYTAVTRAQSRVTVVGTPEEVRAAVERPAQRASGLARRLAGGSRLSGRESG